VLRRFRAAAAVVFISLVPFCAAAFAQGGPGAAAGQEVKDGATTRAALIKEQARKMSDAFLREDFEALFDATYPKIFELAGGREQMLAAIKADAESWRAQKIRLLSYEVGEPGEVKSAGAKLVSVVPTEMKMDFPGTLYTLKSYMLAISEDGGKVWKFVGGANLNKEVLKLLVPEAAEVVTLPKVGAPVAEKKP
jgi:hypothetical protein